MHVGLEKVATAWIERRGLLAVLVQCVCFQQYEVVLHLQKKEEDGATDSALI